VFKLQRKIYVANQALKYFLSNNWKFDNTKVLTEISNIVSNNHKDFLMNYKKCDNREFVKNAIIGAKIYLLNENMDDLEAAKRHCKRLDWLDTILKTLFVMIMLWILYRNNVFSCITDIY
ncbi:PREDICTED: fatty acyl-CoA reductase 1-like, partial [Vollenhovia emeryi]|uniref:fatty acyl-CoA reductase 1-like n=1 Tax=Vollenhovia emeryi TaxID=411798 RepID=UPI0005F5330B